MGFIFFNQTTRFSYYCKNIFFIHFDDIHTVIITIIIIIYSFIINILNSNIMTLKNEGNTEIRKNVNNLQRITNYNY